MSIHTCVQLQPEVNHPEMLNGTATIMEEAAGDRVGSGEHSTNSLMNNYNYAGAVNGQSSQPTPSANGGDSYSGVGMNGSGMNGGSMTNLSEAGRQSSATHHQQNPTSTSRHPPDFDYLTQLMKDKRQLAAFPNVFTCVERLLDEEIGRVRMALFQCEFQKEPLQLPDAQGEIVTRQEKVFVPVKAYPDYNFVGRILGPRGLTAKQLEAETGCKIMVRGKGSMRDKKKEDANRGKPNWEHLNEDLHVLIQCEDSPNRLEVKLARAIAEVQKLLVPSPEGEDELKKKQLMELAIINGTYRNGQGQPVGLQTATGQPNPSSLGALNLAAIAAAAGQKPAAYYLDPRTAALLGSAQNPLAALSTTTTHSMVAAAAPSGVFSAGIRQSPNLTGAQLMMQSPISSAAGTKTTAAQQQQAAMAAAASAQQQQHNAAAALVMAQQQAQAQQQLAALQQLAAANQYAGATNQSTALDYQLLLSSMQQQQMDPTGQAALAAQAAAYQQHHLATMAIQQANAANSAGLLGDYAALAAAGLDATGQSLAAAQQQQRRFLGQHRDHPYHPHVASSSAVGKRDAGD